MPGTILSINVKAGDTVKKGQVLCILEAMKMENEIMAGDRCNSSFSSYKSRRFCKYRTGISCFRIISTEGGYIKCHLYIGELYGVVSKYRICSNNMATECNADCILYIIISALKKGFEPLLLVPIAFGMLLANLPGAGLMNEPYHMRSD